MKRIGLLPHDIATREIAKLIKLLVTKKDLEQRIPISALDKVIWPIQKQAVSNAIQTTVRYLHYWQVDIRKYIP